MFTRRFKFGRYLINVLCLTIFILNAVSCNKFSGAVIEPLAQDVKPEVKPQARPLAVLKTGRQPLWFQLTETGPVHLGSIEDAAFSAAFIPWTLAPHICFFQEKDGELIAAVNRDGFLKFTPDIAPIGGEETEGLLMYRFSGGEFWKRYTTGSLFFYDEKPTALLYLDDRFLDSNAPLPSPSTWTFNMESNIPFPLEIPALEIFSAKDGWNVNTLRLGGDGFWYFRIIKKYGAEPELRMLRTFDLSKEGVDASLEDFQNSASHKAEIENSLLPPLPAGYIYTGEAIVSGNLFACWEEQEDYSIGAAGFVLIKLEM